MSLGRGKKKAKVRNPTVINAKPGENSSASELPKKARSVSTLIFPKKAEEDLQYRTSIHLVNTAKKAHKEDSALYFFKNNPVGSPISELESACCAILHFLAPNNVPSSRPYYDDNQEFVGVSSKALPNFKANRDDPLQEKDIIIEVRDKAIDQQRNCLMETIEELIASTNRDSKQSQTGVVKNFFNYYLTSSPTAVQLRQALMSYKTQESRFSQDSLYKLKNTLNSRKEHILKDINKADDYEKELGLLECAIKSADYLFKYAGVIFPDTIEKLEKIDKMLIAKGIDLDGKSENNIIKTKGPDGDFEIKLKCLKNFRIVRGQAIGEIARYLIKDPDGHNRNMSKDGLIIDFDMAKLNLLFRFRNHGFRDKLFRKPNKLTFVITERDLRFFPDLTDADFFYWPTKFISGQSVIDIIPFHLNLFTAHDNEVYKKLSQNPVFVFYKFKTLLKYILANEKTYEHIIKLHMRPNFTYTNDEKKSKNLLEEFIQDEMDRIQEVRKVLLPMHEFRDFLAVQGKYAYSLIKEELLQYKAKHEKKLATKSYYQDLVDSISEDDLDNRFHEIMQLTGAEKLTTRMGM